MRASFLAIALAALTAMGTNSGRASEDTPSCRASWNVVGACFAMHGRFWLASRKPLRRRAARARITEMKTGRTVGVLGVTLSSEGPGVIPSTVAELMQPEPMNVTIDGDYVVCPFDRESGLRMQMVCIQSAENLQASPRTP